MNVISIIILVFFIIGAVDRLFNNRFGIGEEFEKGFALFAPMALSMLGMLVVAPAIGVWLTPFFDWFYGVFGIDPSIIPASLFANDMGGVALSLEINKNVTIGEFNAYIVSSMMGVTISYTLPVALSIVKKEQHKDMFLGLLSGIVTIPVGCFVSGLILGINLLTLLLTLLPLTIFSGIIAAALIFFTSVTIKVFSVFGQIVRAISIIGLILAVFTFLTKIEIYEHFDTFENAAFICANGTVTLAGALSLMFIVSKLLNKRIEKIGNKLGLDTTSAISLLATIVSSTPTFGVMEKMNRKGVVLNSAFAVSAAFTLGGHLAFTMVYDADYILPMIIGKLISGVLAVFVALVIYNQNNKNSEKESTAK
jgi:ethanolamine transporter